MKSHFIREKFDNKSIALNFFPSEELAADLLMKVLAQVKVEKHLNDKLGTCTDSSFNPGKIWMEVLREWSLCSNSDSIEEALRRNQARRLQIRELVKCKN